ncbi:MAG: hypothetical protein AAFQ41_05190 [Cyanobacteria bacterium J06623_7]
MPKLELSHIHYDAENVWVRQGKNTMDWFQQLTGFAEQSPPQVRHNLVVEGDRLKSLVNGKTLVAGKLETPSLGELRQRISHIQPTGKLSLTEVVGDVQKLHVDPANAGALFQVASQFNLLEMVSPRRTPEAGVGIYSHDLTQGPACAIACGAGTIYRNYFVPLSGKLGQSKDNQLDCLADLGKAWGNADNRLWQMQNGYALASHQGLTTISQRLQAASEAEQDKFRQLIRIGIQWQTQVTLGNCQHRVSQIYCSALPVAYSPLPTNLWLEFAKLTLEAAYEATICTAILNAQRHGSDRLFLTLLGGGAFGNETDWIVDAIARALKLYQNYDLDIAMVSYGASKPAVRELIKNWRSQ